MDSTGGSKALHFPHSHSKSESGDATVGQGNCLVWPFHEIHNFLLPFATLLSEYDSGNQLLYQKMRVHRNKYGCYSLLTAKFSPPFPSVSLL